MLRSLDNVIDDAINPGEGLTPTVVGTVVLVSQCGKRLYQRAAGYADRENKIPMSLDTLFRLSSVTKPFITAATGVLLEQGRFTLDDKVTRWLPWFTPALADGLQPSITIKHLLSHSAGLNYRFCEAPDGAYHRANISDGMDNSGLTIEENLRRVVALPLLFSPGSAIQYSVATDVLGVIIAKECGTDLATAIRTLVTEPLGMKHSGFAVSSSAKIAVPYMIDHDKQKRMGADEVVINAECGVIGGIHFSPSRAFDANAFQSGGAGMIGCAEDIERLLQVFKNGGSPLFSRETLNLLLTDRAGAKDYNPGWGFASSWQVLRNPTIADTPQSPGTIGWGGVYGHSWFIDFENNISTVILSNTALSELDGDFIEQIRDRIYAELLAKES
ncbi:MAG: beta-lactamase family protein [Enterobacteriaceae bacterium]|jgi:CubicO group peptidase (beta-lactamase class C family)|nr:beta-lactamase family protein [Enterobacteriaceae bacterium]